MMLLGVGKSACRLVFADLGAVIETDAHLARIWALLDLRRAALTIVIVASHDGAFGLSDLVV